MPRPIHATIDLGALRSNLQVVRRAAPRARVLAVIKANAYGHGLLRCARVLSSADGFAILEFDSAVRLREAGYAHPILLLEGVFDPRELALAAKHHFSCVLHHPEQVRMLDTLPSGARIDLFVKLNTGMNRLGVKPVDAAKVLAALKEHPRVGAITLMTHFACADDNRGIAEQWSVFQDVARTESLPCSVANSAAILRFPETHCDWVRPGIMLYGCSPFADTAAEPLGLRPVMTLKSSVIGVQTLVPGDAVGYGATFVAATPMRIGVVACGYADGYPRHAPNGTPVLVEGQRASTVGRVSMDMLCVDISALPSADIGSEVTLWGAGLSADEVAAHAGTVSYELLCALAARVPVSERE
jgi:alanine racemase